MFKALKSVSSARSEFWGVASCVPSLQATLPSSPQIFSVISDTSWLISCRYYFFFMQTEIKAPFTWDRINLGPIPDWVQIGFAFTWDLLEPVRCGPLTRYNVGPLDERSKYRPGPV